MTAAQILADRTSTNLPSLLQAQRAAFLDEGPPSAALRRDRLNRLVGVVLDHADDYVAALDADFGHRPEVVSLLSDVLGPLFGIPSLGNKLGRWMRPRPVMRLTRFAGVRTTVFPSPLGVVGVIGPWNFPLGLVLQPAAEAIAAGNRVMIKISEVAPRTADLFARHVAERFDPAELTVVTGGPDIGAEFSRLAFDHLFFTGSPAVGKLVQRAASENLVPVTLELGGKNPAVVAEDADLARAADRLAASRLVNGGQVCLCPDLVFVPEQQTQNFVSLLTAAFRRHQDPRDLTTIVNDKNLHRVVGLVEDARTKGADVIEVADNDQLRDTAARRVPPTILLGVTEEMEVSREEIFGPVLAVHPYRQIEEVISYLNVRPSPLVSYWYGSASSEFDRFRARTRSGGMTRNDFSINVLAPGAPFGGVGQSGMGAYHGRVGFDTFSHLRTVSESSLPWSVTRLLLPPLSGRTERLLHRALAKQQAGAAKRLARG